MTAVLFDRSTIPRRPGVYIFTGQKKQILYVGKAVDLHSRVSSYFIGNLSHPKTASLVENITDCQTIEVTSELEALILEANLIKKYLPPYNIRLTDDKDYLYIKITKEEFPRILTARKKELGDAKEFFGPFPSAQVVRTTLRKLRRIFPWCSNPAGSRPCFYYHLNLCPGACADKITKQDYHKIINRFLKFMQGRKEELVQNLAKEMESYAQGLQFERAQSTKKMIEGLNYLTASNKAALYLENPNFLESQNRLSLIELKNKLNLQKPPERIECYDISNIQGKEATGSMVVLTAGEIDKSQYRKFRIRISGRPNDVAMMAEIIRRRFKHPEWPVPNLILIDGGRGQARGVYSQLLSTSYQLPIFGLAKKREWLYPPYGEVVKLPRSSFSLRLLQKVRDEAHRVATTYHRKIRATTLLPQVSWRS